MQTEVEVGTLGGRVKGIRITVEDQTDQCPLVTPTVETTHCCIISTGGKIKWIYEKKKNSVSRQ